MKQNEVLAMLHDIIAGNQQFTTWTVSTPHLVELVNRAVLREREACASFIEELDERGFKELAGLIRARGEA